MPAVSTRDMEWAQYAQNICTRVKVVLRHKTSQSAVERDLVGPPTLKQQQDSLLDVAGDFLASLAASLAAAGCLSLLSRAPPPLNRGLSSRECQKFSSSDSESWSSSPILERGSGEGEEGNAKRS